MSKSKDPSNEDVTEVGVKAEEEKEEKAETKNIFLDEAVNISSDVPVDLVAVLGRKNISLKDLLRFKVGQTLDLERSPNEFVDLVANGKIIARGELVEIDGKLGVRIIKMLR